MRSAPCCSPTSWRCWPNAPPARAAEQVDLLLVLAADVSRSVDHTKFQLQREGYAAAISDKRVLEAISSGRHRRIAMTFVEWSGASAQTRRDRLDRDRRRERRRASSATSCWNCRARSPSAPGSARRSISPWRCWSARPTRSARRTIDVSGDGTNNSGRDVTARARRGARPRASPSTALVILSERPHDLESRAHQSARRPCELFPRQRHRRAGRVRDRGARTSIRSARPSSRS